MTAAALSWALDQRLKPLQKLVLIYIAEHANMDGVLTMDELEKSKLVSFSDIGPLQLRDILGDLCGSGHIHRFLGPTADGSHIIKLARTA